MSSTLETYKAQQAKQAKQVNQSKKQKLNAKAKAEKMLHRAYDCRHKLKDYTSEAISERHGVSTHTVGNMRNGRNPQYVPDEVKRAIRMDFMRYKDLAEGYLSLDEIALEVCVSRSLVRKWAKELGLTMAMPHKAKVKLVPKRREWEDTAVGRFVTMKLTSCPAQRVPGYY